MADTPTSLAAELRRLQDARAEADAELTRALSSAYDLHGERVAGIAADVERVAGRIEALPVPGPSWSPAFPGDVAPGFLRWGCSHDANSVPVEHETAVGRPVGVRRTFWRIDQIGKIVATAAADIAAGRVPWVSVKLNRLASWAETAAGKIDAQILDLLGQLAALPGPVWLTMHHEPEGGGGTNQPDEGAGTERHWRAMQEHVRGLLDRTGATNIAFVPILMAWTFSPRSGRTPADWWVDGIWDFAGIDNYVEASATDVRTEGWNNALDFYGERGMRIGVGEWGNKDHTTTGAAEMRAWYDHLLDVRSPGACYFDTALNGGVPLSGAALGEFRRLMGDERSVTLERVAV